MFCPQCGLERVSIDTNYCSRCGFLLAGTTELLNTGGIIPVTQPQAGLRAATPRNRGLKQGLFIFLLTFLVVPIVAILSVALDLQPWAVAISSITLFVGGLLRMAYAMMFESTFPGGQTIEESALTGARGLLSKTPNIHSLPAQQSYPAAAYVSPATGNWRDTNDLQPASVTDPTTKLLEKNEIDQ